MVSVLQERLHPVRDDPPVYEVRIRDASPKELEALSDEMGIGLSRDEMLEVQAHFQELDRDPRDIELEAMGQAWSEHCCYKTSKPLLRRHVYGICEDRITCRDDAGVMPFDDDHAYVVKIESHNHPSAIEPYGGAATGIGGVLRDVTCMGAQPIALADPLYFGPPDIAYDDLPPGTKHPKYLFQGVVAGIRDYGNRVGIPTVTGQVNFHPNYLTNCLVNVGCVGIMPKERLIRSRVGSAGDRYILLGGRTGRDGIHGVTFASAELSEESEEESRSAVQVGDPITKEPLIHACLEANEKELLTGMKDLGGGGLSCATGEMALDAGLGAEVHLDQVPLKEPGMKPWEVWVSESQERMLVTVLPDDVDAVLDIARKWDVEATVIGEVLEDRIVRARWEDELIFEMDSEFLYEGPEYERPSTPFEGSDHEELPPTRDSYDSLLFDLLADPNIASKESIIRQYDHEVRGNTLLKPLQGRMNEATHGDAAVLRPVRGSRRGLALTSDVNPHLTHLHPRHGTSNAVDEVVRNLAAVGARLDSLADCLNFPNPERPERMGWIEASTEALGEAARALEVPFVSGNVSMYNESPTAPVPATPSLLGVGIVEDVAHATTTDLKDEDSTLYQVGNTTEHVGGNLFLEHAGGESHRVAPVDWTLTTRYAEAVITAIEDGLVASAHDVSTGGLAVALCEMAFGAGLGVTVDVGGDVTGLRDDVLLFGESPTRWVLEARDPDALEAHFREHDVPLHRLGTAGGDRIRIASGGEARVDVTLQEARDVWTNALPDIVGA